MTGTTQAPTCPGCHFGCELDKYQCARGYKFFGQWQAGEEIPERRMPGPGGPGGRKGPGRRGGKPPAGAGRPGQDEMLAHLLGILSKMLQGTEATDDAARVAEAALRHDGFAARGIIGGRTQLKGDALAEAVQNALERGLVAEEKGENGTSFLRTTDAGKEQAQQAGEQRKQAYADFFSPLAQEEKDALLGSIRTLLDANREKMARK